jgi:hypothetical protein
MALYGWRKIIIVTKLLLLITARWWQVCVHCPVVSTSSCQPPGWTCWDILAADSRRWRRYGKQFRDVTKVKINHVNNNKTIMSFIIYPTCIDPSYKHNNLQKIYVQTLSKITQSVLKEFLCVEMKSPTLLIILGWVFLCGWVFLWKICENARKKYRTT